jgi:hypothetical protein
MAVMDKMYVSIIIFFYLRAENDEKIIEIVIMVIPVMDAPIIADGTLISETDLGNSSTILILGGGGIAARI